MSASEVEAAESNPRPLFVGMSSHELSIEFKDQKSLLNQILKEKKSELKDLVTLETKIKNLCFKHFKGKDRSKKEWYYTMCFVRAPRINIEARIKELERILLYMKKGKGGELDIQKAKNRPISDFIEFNKYNFAKSIFNSSDDTPSMKYYPRQNRVHCFSTGRDEDVIGMVMEMFGLSFTDAVKKILQ
jgi:hypothetical protein